MTILQCLAGNLPIKALNACKELEFDWTAAHIDLRLSRSTTHLLHNPDLFHFTQHLMRTWVLLKELLILFLHLNIQTFSWESQKCLRLLGSRVMQGFKCLDVHLLIYFWDSVEMILNLLNCVEKNEIIPERQMTWRITVCIYCKHQRHTRTRARTQHSSSSAPASVIRRLSLWCYYFTSF